MLTLASCRTADTHCHCLFTLKQAGRLTFNGTVRGACWTSQVGQWKKGIFTAQEKSVFIWTTSVNVERLWLNQLFFFFPFAKKKDSFECPAANCANLCAHLDLTHLNPAGRWHMFLELLLGTAFGSTQPYNCRVHTFLAQPGPRTSREGDSEHALTCEAGRKKVAPWGSWAGRTLELDTVPKAAKQRAEADSCLQGPGSSGEGVPQLSGGAVIIPVASGNFSCCGNDSLAASWPPFWLLHGM